MEDIEHDQVARPWVWCFGGGAIGQEASLGGGDVTCLIWKREELALGLRF